MGYNTYYGGEITITPPLTKPEYLRLLQVIPFWNSESELKKARADVFDNQVPQLTDRDNEIHSQLVDYADFTFNLGPDTISDVGDRLKGYTNNDVFPLVAEWLETNGHQIDGSINWEGDDSEDRGTIYAATIDGQNRVEFITDSIGNPGPSWSLVNANTVTVQFLDPEYFGEAGYSYLVNEFNNHGIKAKVTRASQFTRR